MSWKERTGRITNQESTIDFRQSEQPSAPCYIHKSHRVGAWDIGAMMKPGSLFLAAVLLCIPTQAQEAKLEVRQVADGVYAVTQPRERRFDDSNAVFILLDDGVLVVDSQNAPDAARAVIAEIRKVTDKPVRYVVSTHWHGDHVQGNRAYREAFPAVQIIAHKNAREDSASRGVAALKEDLDTIPKNIARWQLMVDSGKQPNGQPVTDAQKEQLRGRIERNKTTLAQLQSVGHIILPDVTFESSLTLYRRAGEIRLGHYLGHTRGDVVVHLPRERVLVTGDLLDDLPFTGHGSPAALVETLKALSELEWDTMIPGHGSVRQGREHLQQVQALFASIVQQARDGAAQGLSEDDTVKKANLDAFEKYFATDDASRRYWGFFMVEAVKRAWQETKGTVKD